MKWSIWTSLLLTGFLVPVTALAACTPQDGTQQSATAELPAIPGPEDAREEEAAGASQADQADAGRPDAVEGQEAAPTETPEMPDVAAPSS